MQQARRWLQVGVVAAALGAGGFVGVYTVINGHTPWTRSAGAVAVVLAAEHASAMAAGSMAPTAAPTTQAIARQTTGTVQTNVSTKTSVPAPTVAPGEHGQLEQTKIPSTLLNTQLPIQIYLPPGYHDPANATARYPTIYLLHGMPGSPTDWVDNAGADATADAMITTGQLPPAIMVMPTDNRYGASEWANGEGANAQVEDYLTQELVPFIDAHYRTIATPETRAIGGLSTGGYGGLNILFHHPELFRTAFSMSGNYTAQPSLLGRDLWPHHDQAKAYNSPLQYVVKLEHPEQLHVHLDVGLFDTNDDARHQTQQMEQALGAAGVPHEVQYFPGGHTWDYWTTHLVDCLRFVAANLPQ